jgi:hypothetical protein
VAQAIERRAGDRANISQARRSPDAPVVAPQFRQAFEEFLSHDAVLRVECVQDGVTMQ